MEKEGVSLRSIFILSTLFFLLLGGVYLFEEKGMRIGFKKESSSLESFNLQEKNDPVKEVRMKGTWLTRAGNEWIVKKKSFPADQEFVHKLFHFFSSLKVIRTLNSEELKNVSSSKEQGERGPKGRENRFESLSEVISKDPLFIQFIFKSGKQVTFTLGKQLLYSEQFYGALLQDERSSSASLDFKNESIVIAEDRSSATYFQPKGQIGRSSFRYQKTQTYLSLKDQDFLNHSLLPKQIEVQNISFSSSVRPDFQVNLEENRTLPMPIGGLEIDSEKILSFVDGLKNLKAQEILFSLSDQLEEKLGVLVIKGKKGEEVKSILYKKFAGKEGLFLTGKRKGAILRFKKSDKNLFLKTAQDFWEKTLLSKNHPFNFQEFVLKVQNGEKFLKLKVPKSSQVMPELLSSYPKAKDLNILATKELLGLFVGEGPLSEANRVSLLNQQKRSELCSLKGLQVTGESFHVCLGKVGDEWQVADLRKKIILHYLVDRPSHLKPQILSLLQINKNSLIQETLRTSQSSREKSSPFLNTKEGQKDKMLKNKK